MPTSVVNLRTLLSQEILDYWSSTTTSNGNAGGTTLVDTALAQLSDDDDFCLNWWVKITSGTASSERQRVSGYVASTKIVTVSKAFTVQIVSSVTYELHRFDPDTKDNAIKRAAEDLFPLLYLPIRDETLVIDDILANSDFEGTFSAGAHASWTNVGAGITVTQETSRVFHGSNSAKIVAGAGAAGQMTQTPTINVHEITNRGAHFIKMVYATAANVARIRLDWDGTNITNSGYHSGKDQWELLEIQTTVPSTATQIKAIVEAAAAGTGFFDAGGLAVNKIYKYTIPSSIILGPHAVRQQRSFATQDAPYDGIDVVRSLRRLRLEGMGILSRPSTDAGTIEVEPPRTRLLIAQAAYNLSKGLFQGSGTLDRSRYQVDVAYWAGEVERLRRQPGMTMLAMSAELNDIWRTEEDSSGRYLVFRGRS